MGGSVRSVPRFFLRRTTFRRQLYLYGDAWRAARWDRYLDGGISRGRNILSCERSDDGHRDQGDADPYGDAVGDQHHLKLSADGEWDCDRRRPHTDRTSDNFRGWPAVFGSCLGGQLLYNDSRGKPERRNRHSDRELQWRSVLYDGEQFDDGDFNTMDESCARDHGDPRFEQCLFGPNVRCQRGRRWRGWDTDWDSRFERRRSQ